MSEKSEIERPARRQLGFNLLLVAIAGGVLVYIRYFQMVPHATAVSPQRTWSAVVMKQRVHIGEPVEVRLQIHNSSNPSGDSLDEVIDRPESMGDIAADSYDLEWISDSELNVGPRDPATGSVHRWVVEDDEWSPAPAPD